MKKMIVLGALLCSMLTYANAKPTFEVLQPTKDGTINKVLNKKEKLELTVASYNIAAGRVSSPEELGKAIKAMNADFVALAEVDRNTERSGHKDQLDIIAKEAQMYPIFGKAIDFEGGEFGPALLSKYPVIKSQNFLLPVPGDGRQHVLIVAEVQVPNFSEPVLFMAAHLDYKEDATVRMKQVQEINAVAIASIKTVFPGIESRVKILAGDFNEVNGTDVMNEIYRYWDPVLDENADNRTWPAINPALAIDHILTYKGQKWEVKDVIIPNENPVWNNINWPTVSDHVPVIAKIKLLEQ
ncbi:endonuclease/exonuclease/phosphatase family protein [uncultured Fusobacterium sp.]|uniref:endonuclease/exonuclease/phosphatase family protein n=1 Tax=uncultured Fusobacterium sp. TaxID=159267 RepID=UPI0025E1A844|nr:endonuclease/exonuclease/phosphatase family protein [uncultured Fusobacterium sp.]